MPTPPGLPIENIAPEPNGRQHIFDTYATWRATPRLTVIGEADYVLNYVQSHSKPGKAVIGNLTARYTLTQLWNLGGRFEYFDDRRGLFSGTSQALKEFSLVADHSFALGFLACGVSPGFLKSALLLGKPTKPASVFAVNGHARLSLLVGDKTGGLVKINEFLCTSYAASS